MFLAYTDEQLRVAINLRCSYERNLCRMFCKGQSQHLLCPDKTNQPFQMLTLLSICEGN
jgi:hypothetical protein